MPNDWREHDDLIFANALARRKPRGSRAGAALFAAGVPRLLGIEDAGERALVSALLDVGVRQRQSREEAALRRADAEADWDRRLQLQEREWGREDTRRSDERERQTPERELRMQLAREQLTAAQAGNRTPVETRTPEQIEARANAAKLAWNMMARGQRPSKALMAAAGIDVELPPEEPQNQPSQEFRERVAAGLVEAGDLEGAQHVLRGGQLTEIPSARAQRADEREQMITMIADRISETPKGTNNPAPWNAARDEERRAELIIQAARIIAQTPRARELGIAPEDVLAVRPVKPRIVGLNF